MLRGYSADRLELTARMRDVLASAAAGNTTRETAAELGVSFETVKAIRAAALARYGARTMPEAVSKGKDRGELA